MPGLTQLARRSLVLAVAAVAALSGCSRQAFRERADKDVEAIISQKNVVPQWGVKNWHVYPDPRARFADPSSPDAPPYPPDDYAAKVLSPNPQRPGKGGVGRHEGDGYLTQIIEWDAKNRAEDAAEEQAGDAGQAMPGGGQKSEAESGTSDRERLLATGGTPIDQSAEEYRAAFASQERRYRIRLDQALEVALYNSREFQDRREDLFLAALPVSTERFRFSAQAAVAANLLYSAGGRDSAAPGSGYSINTTGGVSRRLSTGATLLVQLANQVVVDLSNGRPTVATGSLGLTVIQPFLRGGGLAVTLEALTQAERTMLYAVRSYSRFRSLFYVAIAGQGDYTNNPYGLQGLAQNLGRGIGANLTAVPVGYLPTILRSAVLANERANVAAFEQFQRLYLNLEEGGVVNKLQVGRIEQQLLQGRTTVLQRTQEYVDNIDNFKLQLGIPATVPLELDETPLRPIRDQIRRIGRVYEQFRDLEAAASKFDPGEPANALRERWRRLLTDSPLARDSRLAKEFPAQAEEVRGKTADQLAALITALNERRRKLQDARADELNKGQSADDENARLEVLEAEYDRVRFEQALRRYEAQPGAAERDAKRREADQANLFRGVLNMGMLVAVQARNQRLNAIRDRWPKPPAIPVEDVDLMRAPLDEAYQKVAGAALNNRLDLMNARAQVVDAWRQVTVAANALQGVFDVEYDLATNSPVGGSRPFVLGGSRLLHQIKLRIEPPFVRRAERNNYRATLVAYQRQRRNLMAFEDNIVTEVRTDLRLLRQVEQAFRVQVRALELAYAQVDNARGTLTAPPDPRATDPSAAAAAQTEQLLQVQGALVRAQNDLYTSWVRYLTARMQLYLDIELLPLDARGIWIDEPSSPAPAPAPAAPAPAAGVPAPPGGRAPADPGVPGPGRVDGGPVRGPGPAAVPRPVPDVVHPERLPEPIALPPADRGRFDPAPLLSLPNPDAAPRHPPAPERAPDRDRSDDPLAGRPDPFPPLAIPTPADGDAGGRTVRPPAR